MAGLTSRRGLAKLVVLLTTIALAAGLPAVALGGDTPLNDDFANARFIHPGDLPHNETLNPSGATAEVDEPDGCNADAEHTVWYRITPPSTRFFQADTLGSDFDTLVEVFRGNSLNNLTLVDCNFDVDFNNPALHTSRLTFKAPAGQRHYIRVSAENQLGESLHFNLKRVTPPANDNYLHATRISSLPYETNADNTNASSQTNEPRDGTGCGGVQRATRWYRYTSPIDQTIWANTFVPVDFDTTLGVYTGSKIVNANEIVCNDDQWILGESTYASGVTFKAEAGRTYRFQVGGYEGETGENGELPFRVQRITPELNDDFANAQNIGAAGFSDVANLRRATVQDNEPAAYEDGACFRWLANSVWYSHTAGSATPLRADAETNENDNLAGKVAVYEQSGAGFGSLVLVGCGAEVDFVPAQGSTYMFQFGLEFAVAGPLRFELVVDPSVGSKLVGETRQAQ